MASVCDRGYCSCVQVRNGHWRHRFADSWVAIGLAIQIVNMTGTLPDKQRDVVNQTWLKRWKEQFDG